MKRLTLVFLLVLSWGKIVAEEYPFLNIEQTNGTITSILSTGTTFTFSDGKMIVTQNGTSTSYSLTDLSKMYFSKTSVGIQNLESTEKEESFTVISLSGMKMGKFENMSDAHNKLNKGIYIIEKGKQRYKITVK